MFLGENYTNANDKRTVIDNAENNLSIFLKYDETFKSLSSERTTLSNVRYMQKKLNSMLVCGSIKKEDIEYDLLNSHLNNASNYLKNPTRTYTDSYNHYISFRDFQTMVSIIEEGGGENV